MPISELRRDIISGDWIVIATGRAKRPYAFANKKPRDGVYTSKRGCPFEDPQKVGGNPPPIIARSRAGQELVGARVKRDWFVQVIPNKFPAFSPGVPYNWSHGPYEVMTASGYHEIVITRDHDRNWGQYRRNEAEATFRVYRDRYLALSQEPYVQYVALFHNYGQEAGASIYHPHSQILAIPVIPPDVQRSFTGAERYHRRMKQCVHCAMLSWERREGARIIAESKTFVALCPFASRTAFEIRIFPRQHQPCFGEAGDAAIREASDMLQKVLGAMRMKLHDPPYNFFIHTAPCGRERSYSYYHWHIEILPKLSIWAGFEISTGIEISTISPEQAAAFLRRKAR